MIAFPLFLFISNPECPHCIQNISRLYCSFFEVVNSSFLLQEILTHQALPMHIAFSSPLSKFIIFFPSRSEKLSHFTQLIPASSSIVNTSSRGG